MIALGPIRIRAGSRWVDGTVVAVRNDGTFDVRLGPASAALLEAAFDERLVPHRPDPAARPDFATPLPTREQLDRRAQLLEER